MTTPAPDMHAINTKLKKLEKQNRSLKHAGLSLIIFVGSVLLMGQAGLRKTVEAEKFILRDASGRVRAQIASEQYGPYIAFYGATGKEQAWLGLVSDEPTLQFAGTDEKLHMELKANDQGSSIVLRDSEGRERAKLWASAGEGFELHGLSPIGTIKLDSTNLLFSNSAARPQVWLSVGPQATALSLSDFHNEVWANLVAATNGPRVGISDKTGFSATLGSTELGRQGTGETVRTSAASVVLSGRDGKVIWRAP